MNRFVFRSVGPHSVSWSLCPAEQYRKQTSVIRREGKLLPHVRHELLLSWPVLTALDTPGLWLQSRMCIEFEQPSRHHPGCCGLLQLPPSASCAASLRQPLHFLLAHQPQVRWARCFHPPFPLPPPLLCMHVSAPLRPSTSSEPTTCTPHTLNTSLRIADPFEHASARKALVRLWCSEQWLVVAQELQTSSSGDACPKQLATATAGRCWTMSLIVSSLSALGIYLQHFSSMGQPRIELGCALVESMTKA